MSKEEEFVHCCDVFPRIAKHFEWIYSGDDGTYSMPFLRDPENASLWRINNCPSCGKEIRGVTLTEGQYLSLP